MTRRCKLDSCREPAVKHGKQYCQKHMDEYKKKKAEWRKRHAALPECSVYDCSNKAMSGQQYCRECATRIERNDAAIAEYNHEVERVMRIFSLGELKDYLISQIPQPDIDM